MTMTILVYDMFPPKVKKIELTKKVVPKKTTPNQPNNRPLIRKPLYGPTPPHNMCAFFGDAG